MASDFLQAYLDESGTHQGAPILSVAGYFGTQDQWNKYLGHWPYRDFHACESSYDKLKPQLAHAIQVAGLDGVEVCLRPREIEQLASTDLKANVGNAYAIG